jgi:hypothetical protein
MPIIVEQYPFYAPMICALYTLGLRYCHVAAMRWSKLSPDGVIAIENSYDVSANVFSPMDARKKAPPMVALEPRTLELVHGHRRYLMDRNHLISRPGSCSLRRRHAAGRQRSAQRSLAGGAGGGRDRLSGDRARDQAQLHDLARQQGVPDAVVKAMAGRAGAEVAQRGQDKHLHYSRGVTVEEMRQAAAFGRLPGRGAPPPRTHSRGREES